MPLKTLRRVRFVESLPGDSLGSCKCRAPPEDSAYMITVISGESRPARIYCGTALNGNRYYPT
jgi:hypothetical protein